MTKAQVIALIDQYIYANGNEEITAVQVNSVLKALANQDIPFSEILSKPTTLSGYGITDAVPTSRTINTGLYLSGGGNLSSNRTISFVPTVNNWVLDNEGNQRIFLGGTISANGVLFQASTTGQEFQYRNSAGTKQFWVTDTGSINGSNIITSGSGNFGTIATITGSSPAVRFTETGSSRDWRIIVDGDAMSFRKQGNAETSLIMRSDNTNEFFGTLAATGGNSTQWNAAYGWGNHASAGYAPSSRSISAGDGLTGGGNLTANRTLSLTNIAAGNNTVGALRYNGTTKSAGRLYGGSSNPSNTTRLNYDGHLYVAELTSIRKITANGFYESSDIRLKENIAPLNYGLKDIEKIDTHTWNWKEDGKSDIGLIAQELELIMPELVKTDTKGYKSVNYSKLIPVLINAIKELSNGKKS